MINGPITANGDTLLHAAPDSHDGSITVGTLLELGAETDAVSDDGEAALILAQITGHDNSACFLLQRGASVFTVS